MRGQLLLFLPPVINGLQYSQLLSHSAMDKCHG